MSDNITINLPPDHALRNVHHSGFYRDQDDFNSSGARGKGDVDSYGNPDEDYADNIAAGMNVAAAEKIRDAHYMRMSTDLV